MMTKKVLAIILLLFIIVVSLSFSHFLIPSSYIENMETNEDEDADEDADEDVLLNNSDDTSSSSAPSPSNETKSIPKGPSSRIVPSGGSESFQKTNGLCSVTRP